ncbi:TetR/AcrR family transcriptional regulator, partial [Streptomyces sp. SID11233]|nr:TetR/AcrR family transcriptional regulator [Streptomyces sp. SID11233]
LRALRRYRDDQTVALVAALDRSGPVRERLYEALLALAAMDLADPDRRGCLAVNTATALASTDPEATDLVRRMLDLTEQALTALVEEGQRAGEIAGDRDAAALGSLLMNTVVGMRVVARVAESGAGAARLDRVIRGAVGAL